VGLRGHRDHLDIRCECANSGCTERLEVPIEEYERVRKCPGWLLIVPGHVIPHTEHVIEQHGGYDIVKVQPLTGALSRSDLSRGLA